MALEMRRVHFEYLDLYIDIYQADVEENPLFNAAAMTHLRPLHLAAQMGRLKEETAEAAIVMAYAEGVVAGSPTAPLDKYTMADWAEWLTEHPDEMETLRLVAEAEWVPV